jgi:hypothetical protein
MSAATHDASLPDYVRTQCRLAFSLARNGLYASAQRSLSDLHEKVLGNLKLEQRVATSELLVTFLKSIREDNMIAADSYLALLRSSRTSSDPETVGQIDLLEVAVHIKRGRLNQALDKVSTMLSSSNGSEGGTSHNAFGSRGSSDISHHVHLMICKASIFLAAGQARKAFSIALRSAAVAERLHLVPLLLETLVVLSKILNAMGEYEAAKTMAESALPAVSVLCLSHFAPESLR